MHTDRNLVSPQAPSLPCDRREETEQEQGTIPQRGETRAHGPGPGTDLPGAGSATARHPTVPRERRRVGWGGDALPPAAASLAGESSWVMGNGTIINRAEEEEEKKNPPKHYENKWRLAGEGSWL